MERENNNKENLRYRYVAGEISIQIADSRSVGLLAVVVRMIRSP